MLLAFGTMQFLCAPLLGALSDRYGRRPVLLASITGMGLMFLATPLVTSLGALVATRLFGGALAANFSVANAYVAEISSPEQRARGFGMIGTAFGIGFVLGPMAGGLLKRVGERRLVLIGLTSATLAYAAYCLATSGSMMYSIIAANLLGFTLGPALQAIVSKAALPSEQGPAMGALSSLASLVGVIAPLLAEVSHLPANDWKVGAPFFLSSLLSGAALALAALHFARHEQTAPAR